MVTTRRGFVGGLLGAVAAIAAGVTATADVTKSSHLNIRPPVGPSRSLTVLMCGCPDPMTCKHPYPQLLRAGDRLPPYAAAPEVNCATCGKPLTAHGQFHRGRVFSHGLQHHADCFAWSQGAVAVDDEDYL